MVNESAFQNEVLPPLLDNFLLPSLRSSVRLSNARRVHNIQLGEAFIRRQTQLRRRGFPSEVSYAFFLLDGSDPDEEERLCEEGLRSGHSVLSHLGPSDQVRIRRLAYLRRCARPALAEFNLPLNV